MHAFLKMKVLIVILSENPSIFTLNSGGEFSKRWEDYERTKLIHV